MSDQWHNACTVIDDMTRAQAKRTRRLIYFALLALVVVAVATITNVQNTRRAANPVTVIGNFSPVNPSKLPPIVAEHPNEPERPRFRPGQVIGKIEIARLHVSAPVIEGSDEAELKRGAGHVLGTAEPGSYGNVAIAAHRDKFFRPLRNIRAHDVITLDTPRGVYRYVVRSTEIVKPTDVSVLRSDGKPELTLVTCYPFYYVGHAPKRFIVHAQRAS